MQIWRRVKLLNRQLIAPNKRVSFKLNRDIYNYKMYIAMAGVFSLFVLPNHSKAEAPKEEGGGARNMLAVSNQSVSESDLCMRSDAAFKALAEITIKGLHGPKGRFLSDGEQQDCMAKERQKYENLVESVRSNGVPDDSDEEDLSLEKADQLLNEKYKSSLHLMNSGLALPVAIEQGECETYFFEAEELKKAQRAWMVYRDQNAKWFANLNPNVKEAEWLSWITRRRIAEYNHWLSLPVSLECIQNSTDPTPEMVASLESLRAVMKFCKTQETLAGRLDTRGGNDAYNELLDEEWPKLESLLLRFLNAQQTLEYRKAVANQQTEHSKKSAEAIRSARKIMKENAGGSLASIVGNGISIYARHDKILILKCYVNSMPRVLRHELMVMFQKFEKYNTSWERS